MSIALFEHIDLEGEVRPASEKKGQSLITEDEAARLAQAAYDRGLSEGRTAGETAARAAERATRAAAQAQALADLADRMEALASDAAHHRAALEAEMLDFAQSVCERVLPEVGRLEAVPRARAHLSRALRLATGSARAEVRLAPATLEALRPALEAEAAARGLGDAMRLHADAELAEGDVEVTWEGGAMRTRFETIQSRILGALRARTEAAGTGRKTVEGRQE